MITVQTVRFDVKPAFQVQFENAVARIIQALRTAEIDGIRYTMCRSGEGTMFLGVLQMHEGMENPLPGLPEGREFLTNLGSWLEAAPERGEWTQVFEFSSLPDAGKNE